MEIDGSRFCVFATPRRSISPDHATEPEACPGPAKASTSRASAASGLARFLDGRGLGRSTTAIILELVPSLYVVLEDVRRLLIAPDPVE